MSLLRTPGGGSVSGDLRASERSAAPRVRSLTVVVAFLLATFVAASVPPFAAGAETIASPVLTVVGQTSSAYAGRSVAFVDLDDDGKGDLIVGAPGDSTMGSLAGQVMIFFGGVIDATPDATISGVAGEQFGWAVASAGDVDSNGIEDLIVGAPFNGTAGFSNGTAYIFLGWEDRSKIPDRSYKANVTLLNGAADEGFGFSVASAGDANLDGYDDVVVGAPLAGNGRVYVFYGGPPASMDMKAPDKTFTGDAAGDQFGYAVAGGQNVDGDASLDIVAGAPADSSAQVILNVRRANPKVETLTGTAATDQFGASVAILDYNGDGLGDVAVGAPNATAAGPKAGRAYLYFGAATPGRFDTTADRTFAVGLAGDKFGTSVAGGDPQTDGIGDLLVGAPENDTAGSNAGRAYVFYGSTAADATADVIAQGQAASDQFGFSVASGSNLSADFDANQSADFAVGAPLRGPGTTGAAYLYRGVRVVVPANPTIFGYVLDNATTPKAGMPNAEVTIESPTYSRTVLTTSNGSYGISTPISVPPGTYWINASKLNYFSESEQRTLALDTRTNMSFNLTRLPVVWGIIRNGNISGLPPLQGALVQILNATGVVLNSTTTGASGTYFLRFSQKGAVTVKATKTNYFVNQTSFSIREDQNKSANLTLQHKPILIFRALDIASAPISGVSVVVAIGGVVVASGTTGTDGRVTLFLNGQSPPVAYVNATKAGFLAASPTQTLRQNTTTYLNQTMNRLPTLSGNVRDALRGTAVRGATVDAIFDTNQTLFKTVTTNNQGDYAFGSMPTGTYDVRVTAVGYVRTTAQNIVLDPDEAAIQSFALVQDPNPPSSMVTTLGNGSTITTVEFTITATASDPEGSEQLKEVALWYSYNNTAFVKWAADPSAPYSFLFNASLAKGDGRYGFYTIATDYAGNVEAAPATNDTWIYLDAQLPVSAVGALPAFTGTAAFTVTATAFDVSGVKEVELWYSKDGGAYAKFGTDATAPYSWSFDTAGLGDGSYAFYSIAIDMLNRVEPVPSAPDATTLVDTVLPAVTIVEPLALSTLNATPVALHAIATDAGSLLSMVELQVDSGGYTVVASGINAAEYHLIQSVSLADGAHTIDVRATDRAGLQRTVSVSFTLDATGPLLSITAPATGAYLSTGAVLVTWTASDVGTGLAMIEVRVDGGTWAVLAGTATTYTTPALTDGAHTVDVRATDNAGNAQTRSVSFSVDGTPPTVTILNPADQSATNEAPVSLEATLTDAGSRLNTVEYRVDAGSYIVVATGMSAASYDLVQSLSLADGSHTVSVRATDRVGLQAIATTTFTVDTTLPSLTITAPAQGAYLTIRTVQVTWTASDTGTGLSELEVRVDGGTWIALTASATSYTTASLGDGQHTVDVRATDDAGNFVVRSVGFGVDATPPSVTITAPTSGQLISSTTVTLSWSASDVGSVITALEARIDGGAWRLVGGTSTTFPGVADGSHTIDLRATDAAGNTDLQSVTFRVDATPPSLTITAPLTGSEVTTADVTVTWTGSDAGSGIDHYEVRLDSGNFVSTGTATQHTFTGLASGGHTITVRALDVAGNMLEQTTVFAVSLPEEEGPSLATLAIVGGGVAAGIVAIALAVWYLRQRGARPGAGAPPEEKL